MDISTNRLVHSQQSNSQPPFSSNSSRVIWITHNLGLFQDTCNVWIVKDGDRGILVDFGSGDVLKALPAAGIRKVTGVLMTHHHRDQAQGLALAVKAGARVWVPYAEQDLFQAVDQHWQSRQISNNYNLRQDRFSLLEPVPISGTLKDYATVTLGNLEMAVIPTPGHTPGSISLLARVDGLLVAFTGDLIAGPGKVWSLAATQWTHNGAEGVPSSILSLLDLKQRRPDILLPSHGEVMWEPEPAIELLVAKFQELLSFRFQNPRLMSMVEKPYVQVTPHLLCNRTSESHSYVLLSESRKALLIDFGYDFMTGAAPGSDRASRRPWLYTLPTLKQDWGVETIDVVIPTHYHDDHVAGLNLLRRVEGTQVWASENFADILENPLTWDLPCLWYDPIPVDRVLPLETEIPWEEYTIKLHDLPGHTRYAAAVTFRVDNLLVLITGDQYLERDGIQANYMYQSRFRSGDYRLSAGLYRRLNPDLILSGHWDPVWVTPAYLDELEQRGEMLERLHNELLAPAAMGFQAGGMEAYIRPYQAEIQAEKWISLRVAIWNPHTTEIPGLVRLVVPKSWDVTPSEQQITMRVATESLVTFSVRPPKGLKARRVRVAADITIGCQRYGQLAEALLTVY